MNATHDLETYARELTDPRKGYIIVKQLITPTEVDQYRKECEAFLQTGRVIHARINRRDMYDYIHPRTVTTEGKITKALGAGREANTYRIYQFIHNAHSPNTEAIMNRTLSLRNQIEERWLEDETYRAIRDELMDYVQVTKYLEDSLGLPKHQDSKEDLPRPLLQCLMLMSQPGVDFRGGDLVIYPREGAPVRAQADLGAQKGDVIYFDKFLFHEVEPTERVDGNTVGRWSAVIGGRDRAKGSYFDRYRYSTAYLQHIQPLTKKIGRMWGRFIPSPSASA